MKITIDTKEDSHEEIKKIIRMLSSLVGEETFTNQGNIFENQDPVQGQNVFGMFDSSAPSQPQENKEQKESDDIDIDIPDIEEYH